MNKIERQVLRVIGEDPTAPDVFIDTDEGLKEIRLSINDAIQELNLVNGGYSRTFHIPLVANASFYRLVFNDGYMGWVQNAWNVGQKRRLSQTDQRALRKSDHRWFNHTGEPEAYFPVGVDVLGLFPKPSASGGVVSVDAIMIPGQYTNDKQKIRLMNTFTWAVVNYAASEFWASRGDHSQAAINFSHYVSSLNLVGEHKIQAERLSTMKTQKTRSNDFEETSA